MSDELAAVEGRMEQTMSDISEAFWCAGWMGETEYAVWGLMTVGGRWGMGDSRDVGEELGALRTLSARAGVWLSWPDYRKPGPTAVPLDEWQRMYDAWAAARLTAAPSPPSPHLVGPDQGSKEDTT